MIETSSLVIDENTQLIEATALHVDTVKISHAYRNYDLPPPEELEDKGFELTSKRRKNSNNIISNNIITAHLKPTYFAHYHLTVIKSDFGYCGINIELSLAKYHDNSGLGVQTDDDIDSVFYEIDFIIRQLVGVKFDSRTAKVSRLDVNADFPVGEDMLYSYLNSISRPNSRYTPATFGDTTRQFHNKSRKLIVYGKYEEVKKQVKKGRATVDDLEAAKGILRLEVSLRKAPLIRLAKKLNLSAEASKLINLSVGNHIISEGLHHLRLDMTKISNDKLYRLMSENFGTDAPLMLGIIQYREAFGDDFWKVFGWSQATYYRKIKRLKDANLWDISPDEELPALVLP
ncbi:MAG TPA: phage/plasmid replication protein [Pyrinomonadaceae bacterium]|jgi:hypothetical protein